MDFDPEKRRMVALIGDAKAKLKELNHLIKIFFTRLESKVLSLRRLLA